MRNGINILNSPRLWVCITLLLVASAPSIQAQRADSLADLPFESYSFIQYAATDGPGPQNILRLDNNGEIALLARKGITREEIEVTFTESQIALLKTFRLLEERNDTLTTAFPILPPEQTRLLRLQIQVTAPHLAKQLADHVGSFVEQLRTIGREGNAYTILFSYVLDGLVWDELEQRALIDVREISSKSPLWAGEVWALHPPRAFASGTNAISEEGVSLKVNWTEDAIPHMLPFVADFPTLIQMFEDYRTVGAVENSRVREVFGPFDLFDAEGEFTIPVLIEEASNPLYSLALSVAKMATDEAPALLDLAALVEEFGFRDEKQALIIAYHELMWDVMDYFEEEGMVRKPVAFSEPNQAEPADIADLVFIVRSPRH